MKHKIIHGWGDYYVVPADWEWDGGSMYDTPCFKTREDAEAALPQIEADYRAMVEAELAKAEAQGERRAARIQADEDAALDQMAAQQEGEEVGYDF